MNSDRWRTSIHESAHGVVCVALGGRCDGVQLFPDGTGVALGADLYGSDRAFMAAAGPVAEYLANEHSPPLLPPSDLSPIITTDHVADDLPTIDDVPIISPLRLRSAPSDDRNLAEWAITGFESEPERWAERVQFARHIARKIVSDHAALIVQVATELFIRGRLDAEDILQITSQKESKI